MKSSELPKKCFSLKNKSIDIFEGERHCPKSYEEYLKKAGMKKPKAEGMWTRTSY